ncbi:MAG: cob(I)yrinic acid a,c-diamide adenosyltransferase [Candidatus Neomarinimicrobiota bacterium]
MRITKVTTKAGDGGRTSLGDGQIVAKSHPRIAALGDLDELNACLGFTRLKASDYADVELEQIQQDLFNLGGEMSLPGREGSLLGEKRLKFLEERIAEMNSSLPALKEFILPGGDEFSSRVHLCRTICRRAERSIVILKESGADVNIWIKYINRLSDYLFVLARFHMHNLGKDQVLWKRSKRDG